MPKTKTLCFHNMRGKFFVPVNNHYICDDLIDISKQQREPKLYKWLNDLDDGSVLFDVGTSYGQEAVLASSLSDKNIQVFGFDCSLYQSHFCALNKALNKNSFRLIFAAVGQESGKLITMTANSDTHIPSLHKKNVPYNYEVMTLALDDFAKANHITPTHLKIDVDGAEYDVLKGASHILTSKTIKDVFIEIDDDNLAVIDFMKSHQFDINWQVKKKHNIDILFSKS
jgi:FkbM family methyltransferase